ncbi:MAG: hypothetical protein ABIG69_12665 [Bacteroidota bacterium]
MVVTSYKDIIGSNYNLAPSQLMTLGVPNKNKSFIRDLLSRKLKFSDNGNEVGSVNYISKSPKYFIRAKALQKESFLPFLTEETAISIRPQIFTDFDLKAGDILISKDSNIGEAVILDKDLPNHTISGALYKLPVKENKYYLFAFLKHKYFLNQLDLLVPKGATIRHAKTLFVDCKVPFPNQKNKDNVVTYVELLTQAIIAKEKEIRKKYEQILIVIEQELLENQKDEEFEYQQPSLVKLKKYNRINAGFYSEYFSKSEFTIKNYRLGFSNIKGLGFNASRGQNLQISCIGKSIYSDKYKEGFYTVIKPKHLSIYGTAFSREYLGNAKKLKTLKAGDIIFGAEGFNKGRSMVILKDRDKTITNIHGITINHKEGDISLSIFIKCFLDYLRKTGMTDLYAVGGNGGSLAMKYLDIIPFPNFPKNKQEQIIGLYNNLTDYPKSLNLKNFLEEDQRWNEKSGIIEIDKSTKQLKKQLNSVLDKIVNDEVVNLEFV